MKEIKFINDKIVKKILTSEKRENREYLARIQFIEPKVQFIRQKNSWV